MRFKMKLAKHRGRPPDKSNEWKSPQKPSEETPINYSTSIKDTYKERAPDKESENKEGLDQKVTALRHAMDQSAESHIENKPKSERPH